MTSAEYKDYEARVKAFFEREEIEVLGQPTNEPFFSHNYCECCGRPLGGNRYTVGAFFKGREKQKQDITYDICVDCWYYVTYGQLDDMTMMEIDQDEQQNKDRNRSGGDRNDNGDDNWGSDPARFRT